MALDDVGRPNFNFLQHSKSQAKRICYFIFDLLVYQNRDLTQLPLVERRDILRSVLKFQSPRVQIAEYLETSAKAMLESAAEQGLEGVVATTSKICYIDGDRGVLAYRGIDIHELAHQSNFEETCHLLWFGKLPNRRELRELHERLAEERKLDASIITLLRNAPRHALPMDVLRKIGRAHV